MEKLISIFIIVFFVGCTQTPEIERPNLVAIQTEKFKNSPEDTEKPEENSEKDISKWWTRLDDPESEKLVEKLLSQNFDIQAAYARLRQAIAGATIAGADLYPTLSGNFDASRRKSPPLAAGLGTGKPINNFDLSLSTQWQLDLFGRTQSDLAGRKAEIEASIFEIDALIHSLIAQAVGQRIEIAINTSKLELIKSTIESREKTLAIIDRRYRYGAANSDVLDVRLARENLASTKSNLPIAEADLKESIYELDLLLGQIIGKSEEIDYAKFELIPPPLKIITPPPAALLDRRPDLRASELRTIAANEDIGVAIADLYPNLSISASFGTTAQRVSDLLQSDQIAWSVLGSLTQKIFAGGALRANIRFSEARKDELVANYKNSILTAVKEVETALLRDVKLSEQVENLKQNLVEANAAARIAKDRYSNGIGDILALLETERRQFQTAQNLLNAQQASWQNRIALYLALGGDWNFNEEPKDDGNAE